MARIPRLATFLDAENVVELGWWPPADCDAVAGWGNSSSSLAAKAAARQAALPFWHVEDGFFRSVGLGKAGAIPFSLVRDSLRPCYDAHGPSDFEALMRRSEVGHGRAVRELLVEKRLSKYNCEPDLAPRFDVDLRRRILIVDQVAGDRSIAGAMADAATFRTMVDTARIEHAEARLLLRVHPDVAAGKARGVLADRAAEFGLEIVADRLSPHALLDVIDEVWTVSSQLGCEALLRGIPVVTFGLPFYAGWGLSDDRGLAAAPEVAARRGTVAGIDALAAAIGDYSRFVDPIHGVPLDTLSGLSRLAWTRDRHVERTGDYLLVGMQRWKRASVAAFFDSPFARVRFAGRRRANAAARAQVVVWGYRMTNADVASLERRHGPVWRMEDGFLRSTGLGSDFVPPASAVIGAGPLYFDATARNSFERLVEGAVFSPETVARATALRREIIHSRLSKYNLPASDSLPAVGRRRFELVVGQVENDASIRLGASDVRTNGALLKAVRERHPDAFIVFKEHPDVAVRNRPGRLSRSDRAFADLVLTDGDIVGLIEACDRLHTMTSLSGFEALLRQVPVTVYGKPFYSGWGLTQDIACEPRGRSLSLDELVASTLILYPRYVDPVTRLPCEPEDVVRLLRERTPVRPLRRAGTLRWIRRSFDWAMSQAGR